MKKYSCKHIGETHKTKEGYVCGIIDGGSKYGYCTIQIKNWISEKRYDHVKDGEIKYPYHKSVLRVGFIGEGKYIVSKKKKYTDAYKAWTRMLKRCYSEKTQQRQPTYKNVTVYKEWHNFQVFAEWFYEHYIEGYELDKDLLSNNIKKYSPETCLFIPQALNAFLANKNSKNTSGATGVYWCKTTKKWVAGIGTKSKKTLGYFNNKKDAIKAYDKARKYLAEEWKNKMKNILSDKSIQKIA